MNVVILASIKDVIMHVPSIWEKRSIFRKRDNIIVGAGIVGISAAIELRKTFPEQSILIIDKLPYGAAASWRNAGFACFGSVSEISADIQNYGREKLVELVRMRYNGLRHTIQLLGEDRIGLIKKGGFEVFRDKNHFLQYADKIGEANSVVQEAIGKEVFYTTECPRQMSFYPTIIANDEEGMLDTGELMSSLKHLAEQNNIEFIHGLQLDEIKESETYVRLILNEGSVHLDANRLLICTNAFSKSLTEELDVVPARNQVIVSREFENLPFSGCYHYDEGFVYFRDLGKRLLIGGARNNFAEEATDSFGMNEANIMHIVEFVNKHIMKFSVADIDHRWSGIISGGPSKLPIIRRLSERVTAGVRLGGMGVAIGPLIGIQLAALSCEKSDDISG